MKWASGYTRFPSSAANNSRHIHGLEKPEIGTPRPDDNEKQYRAIRSVFKRGSARGKVCAW
jgi:hypothetical protein